MNREYHELRKVLATHVTPAILPKNFSELEDKLHKIESIVDWVQVDVVDGVYAGNKTWPFVGDSDSMFSMIVKQDEPMPCWDSLNFEIDLMVANPLEHIDSWIAAGAMRLVIHIDSIDKPTCLAIAQKIEEKGVELVFGVGTDTSIEKLVEYISSVENPENSFHKGRSRKVVNWVQCMGIDKIGFQGEPFSEKVLTQISKIKQALPYMYVSVDGAVSLETAPRLVSAGADRLVVGSALFTSDSLRDVIVKFSEQFTAGL
jgi:ribulose-phosphate 3-epimerase